MKPCIYVLCSKDYRVDEIYIGSTMCPIQRSYFHGINVNKKNTKVYSFIRNTGGMSNWKMIIVEYCEVGINRKELITKEALWYRKLRPSLNMIPPRKYIEVYMDI
jgi:hypothetical protein